MTSEVQKSDSKIIHFARRYAPYSAIDRGVSLALSGQARDLTRISNHINGTVEEENQPPRQVKLEVIKHDEVAASCSCSSPEDMREQWCAHAVALLFQSEKSGLSSLSGAAEESDTEYNINNSTAADIADTLRALWDPEADSTSFATAPVVSIRLAVREHAVHVQVLCNGEIQGPRSWYRGYRVSPRELDNLLLRKLDDEAVYDQAQRHWVLQSARAVDTCLGLIAEYTDIVSLEDERPVALSPAPLGARLVVHWLAAAAELALNWILPDGAIVPADSPILGRDPQWTLMGNTLYRLSGEASRISSLFPHSSRLIIQKSQCAPLLEFLSERQGAAAPWVDVLNPEEQPQTEVKNASISLDLELRESPHEHFFSAQRIRITASLRFDYPRPRKGRNVVYLPDREQQRKAEAALLTRGFEHGDSKSLFAVTGDTALDFVHNDPEAAFEGWKIRGLDEIRHALRLTEIDLSLTVQAGQDSAQKAIKGTDNGRIDWFECELTARRGNVEIPISSLFRNLRFESEHWIQLADGTFARIPGGGYAQLKTSLGFLDSDFRFTDSIKKKIGSAQAISLCQTDSSPFTIVGDRKLEELVSMFRDFSSVRKISPSRKFKGKLRPYQKDGLGWLDFLRQFEFSGILADEMGLGKTVQALALLQRVKEAQKRGEAEKLPSLVVAPTSVITNWMYEAARFTPDLSAVLLHGPKRREEYERLGDYDLVITSYALLRFDRAYLEREQFLYLILDEAQNIKNHQAATTRSAKSVRARHRLAMTGTPTENRPLELWSIFDFLMPGYLGNHEFFKNLIEKPILEQGTSSSVTSLLNSRTRPFILRRRKAEVEKDLPPKIETTLHVTMAPSQAQLYSQVVEEVRPKIYREVEKSGIGGAAVHILAALLRLRQICNHPNSIRSLKDLAGFDSGKFTALKELLSEAVQCNRKVLLYSQFRDMLRIIREWVGRKNIPYTYLDGQTRERQKVIDEFNNNEDVRLFLISLKAGGTGLNLTAADMVIIYDPWWNPAVELQAIDRTHRIGQTKTVSVYRMITEDSIEQKIMLLKEKKSRVVDALINENGLSTLDLTKDDLEGLFAPLPPELLSREA